MPDPSTLGKPIPASTMRAPGSGITESKFKQIASGEGAQTYALSIATVMQVDYEKHHVTLRTENGETFENAPIAMTYPGAGARHFLGAMPMPGDVAVIGWGAGESGKTRQPYVLGWFAAPMAGHDWWLLQPFGQDEYNLTPTDREIFEGITNRTRYKLRHMLPGNIVASSAQGSDLVLDDGVMLSNRRGNELRLRDQDQALVVRTLQQFQVGAGFRVYAGIVQRDALLLPSAMFSDGIAWDAAAQVDQDGNPLTSSELGANAIPLGFLTPNKVFQRDANGRLTARFEDGAGNPVFPFSGNVDPYVFLQKGLFIDTSGYALNPIGDAVYGGKAIYRVSEGGGGNAAISPQADALTEYRIEVSRSSDGTLPVTEQTDGFDADRMPDTAPRLPSPLNNSSAAPFIEFVMGSVVGNDPFSLQGRSLYGVPLRTSIFASPTATTATPTILSGVGRALGEHAAFLFRVNPVDSSSSSSFWSVTKDGRARISIAGPGTDFSAEANFTSGLRLAAGVSSSGESLRLDTAGSIRIRSDQGDSTGRGVEISSQHGSVYIRGSGVAGTTIPTGSNSEPGLTLQSDTDALFRAARSIRISATTIRLQDSSRVDVAANTAITLSAGDAINQVSKTRSTVSLGKSTESYTGPKDGLASNGSVRDIRINTTPATGFSGGVADEYNLLFGDRSETIGVGNHTTSVVVGDATYSVGVGTWTAAAGVNSFVASIDGVAATATVGNATFSAAAGSTTIRGSTAVSVTSVGPVTIRGTTVTLTAPGTKFGGIVSGSDLDPVSGLPLSLLGLGSPTHTLAIG